MRKLLVVEPGLVPYSTAARWQQDLHRRRVEGEVPDVLLLLEHPHVYTLGRRASEQDLLMEQSEIARRGIEVHHSDRGGRVTYHGPGQLVAYPIVDLKESDNFFVDVVKYLRLLEEAAIQTLGHFGIEAERRDGLTGVWRGRDKIASIGVRISRGVAKHGLAINVCPDLDLFGGIVACGLASEGVTSMQRLLGRAVTTRETAPVLTGRLAALLERERVWTPAPELGLEPPPPDGRASKPVWLKNRISTGPNFKDLKRLVNGLSLHTVCEEARCPNIYECWEAREATFLILGDQCTRRCGFCDIATAKPAAIDPSEPARVAEAVEHMGLNYAVVTGVERDDAAPETVARIWAATIKAIKNRRPQCGVEVLTGDLKGDGPALRIVLDASPDVFAHNLETVRRLHRRVRPGFRYDRSLSLLASAKRSHPAIATKSNLILGLGETPGEVEEAMKDLRSSGVDILTIGQYLSPSPAHLPVERWVTPAEFDDFKRIGEGLGFAWVESGPLVRSSYHAGKQHLAAQSRINPGALIGRP